MIESIISVSRRPEAQTRAIEDYCKIRNIDAYPNPTTYTDKRTMEEYSHIGGGVAWPSGAQYGYGILIMSETLDVHARAQPKLLCKEEQAVQTPAALFQWMLNMQLKYGHRDDPNVLSRWAGNVEAVSEQIIRMNQMLKGHGNLMVINPLDGYAEMFPGTNQFEVGVRHIADCLTNDNKILEIGECIGLRTAMENFDGDVLGNTKAKDTPELSAAGALVYDLLTARPWMIDSDEGAFTASDG